MTMAFPESADERIQRALNNAKRIELSDKFGGVFVAGDLQLPADVESEFLQRIEEFELKWASHDVTTVRRFIGDPPVSPLAELSRDELPIELGHLMSTLDDNDIELDFGERPCDEEVYRFIVEELFEHEIDDIRVPGMVCHFIYEEFHPNPRLEVRLASEWFIERVLARNEFLMSALERIDHRDCNNRLFDFAELRARIADMHARVATVIDHSISVVDCSVDNDRAASTVDIRYTGLEAGSMNELKVHGQACVHLRKDAAGDWIVVDLATSDDMC